MKRKAITSALALGFALSGAVALAQTAPPATPGPQDQQMQPGLPAPGHSETGGMTHEQLTEIEGKTVTDAQGEEIGDVSKLVESVQDQRPYAVVSVGGFLGIGNSHVAVPLEELRMVGDELMLTTGDTREQIEQRAGEFQEDNYREIEGN